LDPAKVEKMSGALTSGDLKAENMKRSMRKPCPKDLGPCADLTAADQQIGQLYELMQAIKKRREEGDPDDSTS
jgi:hypothetical protein